MLGKIVILLDGSSLAQCVLPHTWSLAHTFNSDITMLHVLEPPEKTDTGRLDPISWHLQKIEAQSFLNTLAQQSGEKSLHLDTALLEGIAPNRISEYIEETNPDLIVMSSHGSGGLSPWNVSSVAQKIIYRTHRSFMLVRAYQHQEQSKAPIRYRRIAVPLDGSKRAECVLPVAAELANAHEAELLFIHARAALAVVQSGTRPLSPDTLHAVQRLTEHNQLEAEHYLAAMAAKHEPDVYTYSLSGSNPADALLQFVHDNEIDLVVMSAHGKSGETIRPYGSIVSSFIAYGSTSLLVIQDLPQDQIKPTQAEISMANSSNTEMVNRNITYAQPANWNTN